MMLANGLAIALSIMQYQAHVQNWEAVEDNLQVLEQEQLDYKAAMYKVTPTKHKDKLRCYKTYSL